MSTPPGHRAPEFANFMSGESFLIAIFVGVFAGWLVDLIARGSGLPLVGSLTMGALGAMLGGLLVPLTGLNAGRDAASVAINAGIGAALFLFLIKMIRPDDDKTRQDISKP